MKQYALFFLSFLVLLAAGCVGQTPSPTHTDSSVTSGEAAQEEAFVKSWLVSVAKLPRDYVDVHYKDFRIIRNYTQVIYVGFSFEIEGEDVCSRNTCDFTLLRNAEAGNTYEVESVNGPLREYTIRVKRETAEEIFEKDENCRLGLPAWLKVNDYFNRALGGEFTRRGMLWAANDHSQVRDGGGYPVGNVTECRVDVLTGKFDKSTAMIL